MKANHWFFVRDLPDNGGVLQLPPAEGEHAVRARRLRQGDSLTLFDGRGGVAAAEIIEVLPKPLTVMAEIREVQFERQAPSELHLVAALPKGDRQGVMLDMATQLGMNAFTPLTCERSVSQWSARAIERWERTVIEACKQSHRAWLPTIHPGVALSGWLDGRGQDEQILLADLDGQSIRSIPEWPDRQPKTVYLLVGPEGGFSEDERERIAQARCTKISLGKGVLRIETAALALTALAREIFREDP